MLLLLSLAMGAELKVEGESVTVDGAPVRAHVSQDGKIYLLTREGRLQIWQGTVLVSEQAAPGAVGLFVANGRVWEEVHEERAVPVGEAPDTGTTTGTTTDSVPAHAAIGGPITVLRAERGVAVIDRGAADGLTPAENLRFLGKRMVRVPAMEGKGEEEREVETVVGVGRVRVLEEHRALVDVSRGGRVSEGDRVEVRPGAYGYPVAPERHGYREAGIVIRPLLALNTVGLAMVNDAWFTYGFESPWYLQAKISPLGLGWSKDGNPLTVASLVSGGYDGRYFSVGLGAGYSMLNGNPATDGRYQSGSDGISGKFEDVSGAFAFVQEARLGARDGLHLGIRSTLVLVPTYSYEYDTTTSGTGTSEPTVVDEGKNFVFGGISMDLVVPTGDRTDLFADWGTGDTGALWVEGGVSYWLLGNGDPGSVGIRVGAGYASLNGSPNDNYVSLYGPMVSAGARYRF